MAEAKEELDETPPPSKPDPATSDLFAPPTVPLWEGPECGLSAPFTDNIVQSLTPEEDDDSHTPDPFSSLSSVEDTQPTSGRGLVSNGDEANIVMATEKVQEVAVSQPEMVLETAHFTSVLSPPPTEHLMMAEQVGGDPGLIGYL